MFVFNLLANKAFNDIMHVQFMYKHVKGVITWYTLLFPALISADQSHSSVRAA